MIIQSHEIWKTLCRFGKSAHDLRVEGGRNEFVKKKILLVKEFFWKETKGRVFYVTKIV